MYVFTHVIIYRCAFCIRTYKHSSIHICMGASWGLDVAVAGFGRFLGGPGRGGHVETEEAVIGGD